MVKTFFFVSMCVVKVSARETCVPHFLVHGLAGFTGLIKLRNASKQLKEYDGERTAASSGGFSAASSGSLLESPLSSGAFSSPLS